MTENESDTLFELHEDKKTSTGAIIEAAFKFFCDKTEKTKHYNLTPKRRKMAEMRWREIVKDLKSEFPSDKIENAAKWMFHDAIMGLVSNNFLMENGYADWEQIFGTTEKFQRRLEYFEHPPKARNHEDR